ncbi:hypothetical protein [Asticcacaulis sp. 201]|uniref:hypothetical protein n=1 Tax=Asticcacaulis sp. 201 TaxID=3028787 RepID=UPI002915FB16|nr:hypothetical protein [Asticcacaulis sp. 201]MDV6330089.1 hypothetical protein [Asticcacaulis sp. 201]
MPSPDPLPSLLTFPLTVDADLSATAQGLLRRECGCDLHAIDIEAVGDTHDIRCRITVAATACERAMHALIAGLPAAQFGAVEPARAEALSWPEAA